MLEGASLVGPGGAPVFDFRLSQHSFPASVKKSEKSLVQKPPFIRAPDERRRVFTVNTVELTRGVPRIVSGKSDLGILLSLTSIQACSAPSKLQREN
jgi:hypothetical protein